MKIIIFIHAVIILIAACKKSSPTDPVPIKPLIDIDGNGYDTIKINNQFWMKQNLKTSHYRNGDAIPEITSNAIWKSLTTGAWCWYNNDSATYAATYGKLYNWYAINDPRGLAPANWHVPSDAEWTSLEASLGGFGVAGGALKETGYTHWTTPNTGATNSSGFTALPGGNRKANGPFDYVGEMGYWWSSSEQGTFYAPNRFMEYNQRAVWRINMDKQFGHSVRCLKD